MKFLGIRFEEDENFQIRESIYNKEFQELNLKENIKHLEDEMNLTKGKLNILEGLVKNELKFEEIFRTIPEKELMHYLNDMVVKNIDKKQELRTQNIVLLENLMILAKEYQKKIKDTK